ncbi:MAG: non-canonical purine NTP pyrophosphatase [Phycisphaerales bacterium]|nr:non-canonical purine NTP pyrophosphatase [Phycisphaerales bacterium]
MHALLLATSNPHKVDELREILAQSGVPLLSLSDIDGATSWPEPVEDADTFEQNAAIKARYYAKRSRLPCLADDSGLAVDALNGDPGVRSARYANAAADRSTRDAANNTKLLAELDNIPDAQRTARFVCAMCLAIPDHNAPAGASVIATTRGTFEGRITRAPRGSNGFGYDPLLELTDPNDPCRGKTSAELSSPQKHARSHRGAAARAMIPFLSSLPR